MKVGTRLVILLSLPLVLLMLLFGWLDERISRGNLREELKREGRAVALTLQIAIEDSLRDRQMEDVQQLIDRLSGYERIYGARLFQADGSLLYQSPSLGAYPFIQTQALATVLRERRPVDTHRTLGDSPVVTFIVPLQSESGELLGALQVLQLESFIDEDARAARHSIALVTIAMMLATGTVVLLVTHFGVSRPIDGLVRSFREIGSVERPTRVPVHRRDELGRLAQEFNGMCDRLQESQASLLAEQEERRRMEGELRNAERLASLGRLAAGLAHEIGTPLNVIRGRAEALQRRAADNPAGEKNLGIIVAQIDRIARIVRGMLDFSRARGPRFEPTEMVALVGKVIEFLGPRFEGGGVRVITELPAALPPAAADADQIYQVFLNLAGNALDAMPHGGTLRVGAALVRTRHPERDDPPLPFLSVAFEDTGSGIEAGHLGRIFDPFFTTKDVGRGTGLGLSVSYGIVREHGGFISVASTPGTGTRMTVHLPIESHGPGDPDPGDRGGGRQTEGRA